MKITSYGHACFSVNVGGKTLLFDPFITPNPLASDIDIGSLHPDYILLTHGHFDHVADVETIAQTSGATLIGNYEVIHWFGSKGLKKVHPMNSGGSWNFDFGKVTFTTSVHSSRVSRGDPGGILLLQRRHGPESRYQVDQKLFPAEVCRSLLGGEFYDGCGRGRCCGGMACL